GRQCQYFTCGALCAAAIAGVISHGPSPVPGRDFGIRRAWGAPSGTSILCPASTPRSGVPTSPPIGGSFLGPEPALESDAGAQVATVIVEDASRFARELVVQELGIALLAKRGVRLLTASGDDLTDSDDLGRKMMRQVAGAFAEYEKGRLVAKLRS